MKYFKLWPEYDKRGNNYARVVDDVLFLMGIWVWQERPLLEEWPQDLEFSLSRGGQLCDVLFNPLALFYSRRVRDAVEPMLGGTVEWLPAAIQGHGIYYILHPVVAVDLSPDAKVKQNGASDNVTFVEQYAFVNPSELPACFLIRQAIGSPARGHGSCMSDVIVSEPVRSEFLSFRGVDFAKVYET